MLHSQRDNILVASNVRYPRALMVNLIAAETSLAVSELNKNKNLLRRQYNPLDTGYVLNFIRMKTDLAC